MRLLLGLDAPMSGAIRIDGRALRAAQSAAARGRRAARRRRECTRVARARDHLLWLARTNGSRSRVDEMLELVGLADVARKRAGGFSLGMRQRLGIAAALLGDPRSSCSTSRPTGSTPTASSGSAGFLRSLADRAAPCSSRAT